MFFKKKYESNKNRLFEITRNYVNLDYLKTMNQINVPIVRNYINSDYLNHMKIKNNFYSHEFLEKNCKGEYSQH